MERTLMSGLEALWRPVLVFAAEWAALRPSRAQAGSRLRFHAAGAELLREGRSGGEVMARAEGRPQIALEAILRQAGPLRGAVTVEIAADKAVIRRLILPVQPDDVLKAILRNTVEGLAPWPLAQCLWGHRAVPVPGDAAHVAVDAVVLARSLVEDLARQLRAAGAEVAGLGVRLPDGGLVTLDAAGDARRARAETRAGRVAIGIGLASLAVMCAGLALAYRAAAEGAALERETAGLMAEIRGAAAGAGETPEVTAANEIHIRRTAQRPVLAVLDDLSALLPDTAWLTAVSLDDGRLELKGRGTNIPALVKVLEDSPVFRDVNFAAATEQATEGNAAFALKAALEGQAPAGEAP